MEAKKPRRSRAQSPAPAPGRLRLVQDFVNTLDCRAERDELRTPEALTMWLVRRDLLQSLSPLDEDAWRNALEVREGLRAVLAAHGGQPLDDETLERLNAALEDALLRVRFGDDGTVWLEGTEPGWKGAAAQLVVIVFESTGAGLWERLKTCANEECRRAFYDASETAGAKWCDAGLCGDRADAGASSSQCRGPRSSRVRRAP